MSIGWSTKKFSEVTFIGSGQVSPLEFPYSDYIHIGPENIEQGSGRLTNLKTPKELGLKSGKYLFDEASVVYSKIRPNLNKVCLPDFVGICSADMYPIWVNSELEREFLFQYMLSNEFVERATRFSMRTGLPKINRQDLGALPVPLPPLEEQRKIAEILGAWDEAITLTERLIAAKQQRKKALMQQLLTGKVRFGGVEGEWQTVRLEDIAQIYYGKSPNQIRDLDGAYPIYGTSGIVGSTNTILCHPPAVIIGRKGTIDQPRFVEQPFWAIDTTFYCLPKENLEIRWLYYMLHHLKLARYNEASGVPSLSRSNLYRIKLCLPSHAEQRKMANVLMVCDREITLLQQKAAALRQQKKGLMQQLLTGKVRVKV